jgi:hypothetical protein
MCSDSSGSLLVSGALSVCVKRGAGLVLSGKGGAHVFGRRGHACGGLEALDHVDEYGVVSCDGSSIGVGGDALGKLDFPSEHLPKGNV